jgi:hypothetical protein
MTIEPLLNSNNAADIPHAKNVLDTGEVGSRKAGSGSALELVSGHHLCDREKDRSMAVTKLNDIEQGLPAPTTYLSH